MPLAANAAPIQESVLPISTDMYAWPLIGPVARPDLQSVSDYADVVLLGYYLTIT